LVYTQAAALLQCHQFPWNLYKEVLFTMPALHSLSLQLGNG